MDNTRNIHVATLKVIGLVLGVLFAVWLLVTLRVLIVNLIIAVTLASAIAPVAEWGEARRVSRLAMVLAVYFLVVLTYSGFALALAPAVKAQATQLYSNLPVYLAILTNWAQAVIGGIAGDQAQIIKLDPELVHNIALGLGHQTLDMTTGLLALVLDGLLITFLTAYFVIEAKSIWEKLLLWLPHSARAKASSLIRPLGARMGGYVRGQILVSLAVSAFITIGLTVLGVHYSIVLGMLAGLLNLVPFVGSLSACVFALVVSANQSIWLAGAVLALFAFEQWCESNFIVPYLLGRHVELHPLIVLFAVLIGATLMGVTGALVAVPVASAMLFLAQEFYLKPLNREKLAQSLKIAEASNTDRERQAALEQNVDVLQSKHALAAHSGETGKSLLTPRAVIFETSTNQPAEAAVPEAIEEEVTA